MPDSQLEQHIFTRVSRIFSLPELPWFGVHVCWLENPICMIQAREIRQWRDRVVREFRPQKIILFGSYARGTATKDSDVDVLIVMELARGRREVLQAAAIRERVPANFPIDLIVRSPSQIAQRPAQADGFSRDIVKHGRLLYEGEHA